MPDSRIAYTVGMKSAPQIEQDEEGEFVTFPVAVDLATVAWLMEIADACHAPPAAVIASLLRDIRQDDEVAHDLTPAVAPQHLN